MIPSRTVSANCPALPRVIWPKYCSFSFATLPINSLSRPKFCQCLLGLQNAMSLAYPSGKTSSCRKGNCHWVSCGVLRCPVVCPAVTCDVSCGVLRCPVVFRHTGDSSRRSDSFDPIARQKSLPTTLSAGQ